MMYKITRWIALSFFSLLILIPSTMVLLGSFKTDLEIYDSPMALPVKWTLDNYQRLLDDGDILINFKNSVIVTFFSVAITLLLASMVSFAIARLMNVTGRVLFVLFALGLAIPGQVNIIPIYLLFSDLGLTNTFHGLIAVNIVATLPISVFILTSFFRELPNEMYEVASIDGASHLRVFRSIAVPLSRPALGATAIFLFVICWNDLLFPLLLITESAKKTLPLAMLDYRGEYATSFSMIFTAVMVASIPMVVMYLAMQKSFVAGLTAGAVKG
ncbi:MAG: raffinose/stachyose/melibiose transport system permease protein [Actinobacteria bacterium]|nr:raffinose/stachyose/melibiose transport system permease protein [Actinomycetota bacterium]